MGLVRLIGGKASVKRLALTTTPAWQPFDMPSPTEIGDYGRGRTQELLLHNVSGQIIRVFVRQEDSDADNTNYFTLADGAWSPRLMIENYGIGLRTDTGTGTVEIIAVLAGG